MTISRFFQSLALVAFLAGGTLLPAACADDDCIGGTLCECSGGSCAQACESDSQGGCNFTCDGDDCKNTCVGGGCNMDCSSTSCELDCPGGSCKLTCNGAESCRITGCNTACELNCNGASTCESSCTPTAGGCLTTP